MALNLKEIGLVDAGFDFGGSYIMALDCGTTSVRAVIVDEYGCIVAQARRSVKTSYPHPGWVEQDPMAILASQIAVMAEVQFKSGIHSERIAAIGISNQRETTVAWDRATGEPVCDAVVWQCARARELCDGLAAREGVADRVRDVTGLALSPYYPASKMAWILENVPAAAEAAARGDLCLGTIDAWVVWTLTGGREFRCDWSNASRTQLFDIRAGRWSAEMCEVFGIDPACLPEVTDSDGLFGTTDLGGFLPAPVPVHGVLGDSHAALFAQGCHARGMAKATYGTGSSVMMNVGPAFVASSHGLSSSLAWRMGGVTEYVLEGNVNYAGAVKTWLRDDLELINNPEEVTDLCYAANPASRVYFVPAFTGLGAPHWASDAEACVFGMTRTTGRAEFVKAADESIAYQIFDVIDAMVEDSGAALAELRVDGGPTRDAYLMQFESDLVGSPIRIASNDEMSGLGAAWACGIALGMYTRDVVDVYGARGIVEPAMSADERAKKIAGWRHAVAATISYTA